MGEENRQAIFLSDSNIGVYCDVSVVARDKRVNMNDATQIFAVHCLAAAAAAAGPSSHY